MLFAQYLNAPVSSSLSTEFTQIFVRQLAIIAAANTLQGAAGVARRERCGRHDRYAAV